MQNIKKLRLWTVTLLLVFPLFLPTGTANDVPFANEPFDVNNIPEPVPPPKAVRYFFDLDPFYQQWISVAGFPILASSEVSPYALKEAAYVIWQMIGHRRDLLNAMASNKIRLPVIGYKEIVCHIPEHKERINPDFCFFPEVRARASFCPGCLTVTANEENLLHYFTGPPGAYSVLVHEVAHALHEAGLNTIVPAFDSRLRASYNSAMQKGLWAETYAASNYSEYWAESVGSWFNTPSSVNPIHTRDALKTYDPALATLLTEVFGNSDWRWTPSTTRTHLAHLQGFNPQNSPIFERDPESVRIYEALFNPAINELDEWVNLRPYDPAVIPILNASRTRGERSHILLLNHSGAELLVYFVNPDGTEHLANRFPPYPWLVTEFTVEVGGLLLVKDARGSPLALFQAEEKVGRAFVGPAMNLITPGLSKVSGDNQSGLSGASIANPLVIEVRDQDLSPLEGVSVTFTVTAGNGTLSPTRTTTDENGRAHSTLTLGENEGINTVSVTGIAQRVTFTAMAVAAVSIPDTNLRAVIETTIGVVSGTPILPSEIDTVTRLDAPNANISDLTGLQRATNLTSLNLGAKWVEGQGWINSNSVSDLSPLAELTHLTELLLHYNNITDISPVVGLTNLTFLWLEGNNITDISPVADLTHLTRLDFGRNSISDISAIAGLTNVTSLWLWGNKISDITAVAGLTNLRQIGLWNNKISDLSPLVANTGLGNGDEIYVRGNPLSYQSIHTHILALKSRGVKVEFDNRAHPALLKISGDNQTGASFVSLSQPFVVEAQDANGFAFAGVSVTFTVTAGGGTLSTQNAITDANGRAQTTLRLGPNLGANTVQVSATGIESWATFYAIADMEAPPTTADVNNDGSVDVLDLILIASELGKSGVNLVADVNGDEVVDILDLILVAGMFDGAAAAPSAQPKVPETLTVVEVQDWLTDARGLEAKDPIMKRGFAVLEQLLISLTPKETKLLANYPNPFNPETWIPYRLAEDAFVTLTIYDTVGQVVRTLDVGHQIASAYESRSKTIYWDGRNEVGEPVASGIYFYTLTAGDFSATRKMLILK